MGLYPDEGTENVENATSLKTARGLVTPLKNTLQVNFDLVKTLLDRKGLSAYQLSRLSEVLYGRSSNYYIPQDFYHGLRTGTARLNIFQLFALSNISNYNLYDWLKLFGFQLDKLPHLEIVLHNRHTVILDSTNYDKDAWVPWFKKTTTTPVDLNTIIPLSLLLTSDGARPVRSIKPPNRKRYLYAKIGQNDALAFPKIVPGSIVRIDPKIPRALKDIKTHTSARYLYLVEHSKGLSCCNLDYVRDNMVALSSPSLSCPPFELRNEKEIKIWGVADMEIRPLRNSFLSRDMRRPKPPCTFTPLWKGQGRLAFQELIRSFRLRIGLSFREASAMTRSIVELLGDKRYFIPASSLSNYENLNVPPKHFEKILSLCIVYCIGFSDFLAALGISIEKAGREAIPKEFLPHTYPLRSPRHALDNPEENASTPWPLKDFEDVPFFLRSSLPNITGLPNLSFRDVFWLGQQSSNLHPLLAGGRFIVVNRRIKRPPRPFPSRSWDAPLYLMLMRDGSYICGPCSLKNDALIIAPCPNSPSARQVFRNRKDAEIIGQVVTILRDINSS